MVFKKGHTPWNKGESHSEETKKKISESLKKKVKEGGEFRDTSGLHPHKKGEFSHSEESKKKIGKAAEGREPTEKQLEALKKGQKYFKGKTKENCEAVRRRAEILSEKYSGKENPEHSKKMKEYYKKYPEKHPNRIMAKKDTEGYISKPQRRIFEIIKNWSSDAKLEYPIETEDTTRYADIGLPDNNIDIEYDEKYWHKDKDDDKRDRKIEKEGWKIIRISSEEVDMNKDIEKKIKQKLKQIGFKISAEAKKLCPVDRQ